MTAAAARVRKLLAGAAIAGVAGAVAVLVLRRRLGPLRAGRGLAALQLAARGGLRYAGSAPRLFAAAGAER